MKLFCKHERREAFDVQRWATSGSGVRGWYHDSSYRICLDCGRIEKRGFVSWPGGDGFTWERVENPAFFLYQICTRRSRDNQQLSRVVPEGVKLPRFDGDRMETLRAKDSTPVRPVEFFMGKKVREMSREELALAVDLMAGRVEAERLELDRRTDVLLNAGRKSGRQP